MFNKNRYSLLLAAAWLFVLTLLLVLPGSSFPHENWFSAIYLDKCIHIFLFAVLVILWVNALQKKYPNKNSYLMAGIIICLAAISYGITMEFVQKYWVPNRSFELYDIIADAAGSVIGYLFSMSRYIKK
jgi:VanZ family protein